jgi:hypothetical protein
MALDKEMKKIRSNRVAMHSDNLDINRLKREQQLASLEKQNGFNKSFGNNNRNKPVLSPKTKARLEKQVQ